MTRARIKRLKVSDSAKAALLKHHAMRSVRNKRAVVLANCAELVAELVANGAMPAKRKVRQHRTADLISGNSSFSPKSEKPHRAVSQEGAQ